MADGFDPYKTLQVDPEADPDVIQAAYRRLAQKYHPDLASGPETVTRMIAMNRAWEILGDPERRAAYDRERSARERGRRVAQGGAAGSPGRAGAANATQPASRPPDASRPPPGAGPSTGTPPPEEVSRDWTSGRSSTGFAYDPASMRTPDGHGAAGPPPGNPSGSVMNFGRFDGWSLGEIARIDLEYLEWLDRMPIGRPYREEIDAILRRVGRRRSSTAEAAERRGLFRRR